VVVRIARLGVVVSWLRRASSAIGQPARFRVLRFPILELGPSRRRLPSHLNHIAIPILPRARETSTPKERIRMTA
jgi:hypothetical protein